MGPSDFTGKHPRTAYTTSDWFSGFEHAHVVPGGESFVPRPKVCQNALWALAAFRR
jgi:hypothetical protein